MHLVKLASYTTGFHRRTIYASYFATIKATRGLVSYWRLGEATTSSDSFAESGIKLDSRTGEIGAGWTKARSSQDALITAGGRLRLGEDASWARYYISAVPGSGNYAVEADVYVASSLAEDWIAVAGRLNTSSAGGTFYAAAYDQTSRKWTLYRVVTGQRTTLAQSTAQTLRQQTTYRLTLDMSGSTIRLLVDGAEQSSVVNRAITNPGRGGVVIGSGLADTQVTDSTGMHLDNFRITPPMADSFGDESGEYVNGPGLGAVDTLARDSDTAARFDGINDYASVASQTSGNFSIEVWFRSKQGRVEPRRRH